MFFSFEQAGNIIPDSNFLRSASVSSSFSQCDRPELASLKNTD
jgi:hypothetical protein